MGIGTSLVLIAIGAILTWGVNVHHSSGVDIHAIGAILMVVGVVGVAVSMAFWNSWGGPRFTRDRVSTYRDIDGRRTHVEQHEIL